MTGMDVVVELRRSGLKPRAVFVDLVANAPRDPHALSASGIVNVNIARTDSLADIDFRPLVGLLVFVCDFDGTGTRHRTAATMLAAIEPRHLVMPIWHGETLVVHQRWAGTPARTETIRI